VARQRSAWLLQGAAHHAWHIVARYETATNSWARFEVHCLKTPAILFGSAAFTQTITGDDGSCFTTELKVFRTSNGARSELERGDAIRPQYTEYDHGLDNRATMICGELNQRKGEVHG